MAWGNSSKTKSKSKPASKTKAKKVKKKYSYTERWEYHDKKTRESKNYDSYSCGFADSNGFYCSAEGKSKAYAAGIKASQKAKGKALDLKF